MAAFWDALPEINGTFEVGIAANVDPSLADADKLRAFATGEDRPVKRVAGQSALWAFRRFGMVANMEMRKNYACAAYAAVAAGLVSLDDGDVVRGDAIADATDEERPHLVFTMEQIQRCMTTIVSTKVNWWVMNHHTGQGDIQGYPKKVAIAMYGYRADDDGLKEYCKFAHTVGHWASTKIILTKLGIEGILVAAPTVATIDVLGSEDLKLRLRTPPAGTHRHSIVVGITKRLIMHYIARYCSALGEIQSVIKAYNRIMVLPSRYHIGAKYLTGADRPEFDDNLANSVLGRLVTFVKHFAPNASIADSPHVSSRDGGTRRWKDQSYEDFDATFDELCRGVRTAGTAIPKDSLDLITANVKIDVTGMVMADALVAAIRGDLAGEETTHSGGPEGGIPLDDRESTTSSTASAMARTAAGRGASLLERFRTPGARTGL